MKGAPFERKTGVIALRTQIPAIEGQKSLEGGRWSPTPSILLVEVVGVERIVSTSFLSFLWVSPSRLTLSCLMGDNYSVFAVIPHAHPPLLSFCLWYLLCLLSNRLCNILIINKTAIFSYESHMDY